MTPRTLAIVPLDDWHRPRRACATASSTLWRTSAAWISSAASAPAAHSPQWFHERESQNDFVVYAADAADTPWTRLCLRQADVVLLLRAHGGDDAGWTGAQWQDGSMRRAELLLLHERDFANGAAARWQARCPASRTTTCAVPRTTTAWCAC